jgi:hypothetical protein
MGEINAFFIDRTLQKQFRRKSFFAQFCTKFAFVLEKPASILLFAEMRIRQAVGDIARGLVPAGI